MRNRINTTQDTIQEKIDMERWPSTKGVAYGVASVAIPAFAANQVLRDHARIQRMETLMRQGKAPLTTVSEVGMAQDLPVPYYTGRALLQPGGVPAGVALTLIATGIYASIKKAYNHFRNR